MSAFMATAPVVYGGSNNTVDNLVSWTDEMDSYTVIDVFSVGSKSVDGMSTHVSGFPNGIVRNYGRYSGCNFFVLCVPMYYDEDVPLLDVNSSKRLAAPYRSTFDSTKGVVYLVKVSDYLVHNCVVYVMIEKNAAYRSVIETTGNSFMIGGSNGKVIADNVNKNITLKQVVGLKNSDVVASKGKVMQPIDTLGKLLQGPEQDTTSQISYIPFFHKYKIKDAPIISVKSVSFWALVGYKMNNQNEVTGCFFYFPDGVEGGDEKFTLLVHSTGVIDKPSYLMNYSYDVNGDAILWALKDNNLEYPEVAVKTSDGNTIFSSRHIACGSLASLEVSLSTPTLGVSNYQQTLTPVPEHVAGKPETDLKVGQITHAPPAAFVVAGSFERKKLWKDQNVSIDKNPTLNGVLDVTSAIGYTMSVTCCRNVGNSVEMLDRTYFGEAVEVKNQHRFAVPTSTPITAKETVKVGTLTTYGFRDIPTTRESISCKYEYVDKINPSSGLYYTTLGYVCRQYFYTTWYTERYFISSEPVYAEVDVIVGYVESPDVLVPDSETLGILKSAAETVLSVESKDLIPAIDSRGGAIEDLFIVNFFSLPNIGEPLFTGSSTKLMEPSLNYYSTYEPTIVTPVPLSGLLPPQSLDSDTRTTAVCPSTVKSTTLPLSTAETNTILNANGTPTISTLIAAFYGIKEVGNGIEKVQFTVSDFTSCYSAFVIELTRGKSHTDIPVLPNHTQGSPGCLYYNGTVNTNGNPYLFVLFMVFCNDWLCKNKGLTSVHHSITLYQTSFWRNSRFNPYFYYQTQLPAGWETDEYWFFEPVNENRRTDYSKVLFARYDTLGAKHPIAWEYMIEGMFYEYREVTANIQSAVENTKYVRRALTTNSNSEVISDTVNINPSAGQGALTDHSGGSLKWSKLRFLLRGLLLPIEGFDSDTTGNYSLDMYLVPKNSFSFVQPLNIQLASYGGNLNFLSLQAPDNLDNGLYTGTLEHVVNGLVKFLYDNFYDYSSSSFSYGGGKVHIVGGATLADWYSITWSGEGEEPYTIELKPPFNYYEYLLGKRDLLEKFYGDWYEGFGGDYTDISSGDYPNTYKAVLNSTYKGNTITIGLDNSNSAFFFIHTENYTINTSTDNALVDIFKVFLIAADGSTKEGEVKLWYTPSGFFFTEDSFDVGMYVSSYPLGDYANSTNWAISVEAVGVPYPSHRYNNDYLSNTGFTHYSV